MREYNLNTDNNLGAVDWKG